MNSVFIRCLSLVALNLNLSPAPPPRPHETSRLRVGEALYLMFRLSYSTFGVARLFMALCVFFCHVFQSFNQFGFLFVGVFFFMSGYGMEYMNRRDSALVRLIPYILVFFFGFSLVYWILFPGFFPSSCCL